MSKREKPFKRFDKKTRAKPKPLTIEEVIQLILDESIELAYLRVKNIKRLGEYALLYEKLKAAQPKKSEEQDTSVEENQEEAAAN